MNARKKVERAFKSLKGSDPERRALGGIAILARFHASVPRQRGELPEQPFDRELLAWSKLYRRTRRVYLEAGGTFRATLLSSPRTLSSISLLENEIEYTPMESELIWSATDPIERRSAEHFLSIRRFASTLFHEQNHRLLWALLPPPERGRGSVRRYLNFCEATVVALDMALGDELGPVLSEPLYLCGSAYDPGTETLSELSHEAYRRYLIAAALATWLSLEGYDVKRIPGTLRLKFPELGEWADRAAQRALRLDRAFVEKTNPVWQEKNWKKVEDALHLRARRSGRREEVELPEDAELPERLLGMWEATFRWFRL